nr:hypothetical protein [Abalone asfa-like virus]
MVWCNIQLIGTFITGITLYFAGDPIPDKNYAIFQLPQDKQIPVFRPEHYFVKNGSLMYILFSPPVAQSELVIHTTTQSLLTYIHGKNHSIIVNKCDDARSDDETLEIEVSVYPNKPPSPLQSKDLIIKSGFSYYVQSLFMQKYLAQKNKDENRLLKDLKKLDNDVKRLDKDIEKKIFHV